MKLIEISFEVCNKVGGIYTVVSSKAHITSKKSDYIAIGPWTGNNKEFHERDTPDYLEHTKQTLAQQGVHMHFGHWQIPGNPRTILLEFSALWEQKNRIKTELYNEFGIDSLYAGHDFEEPMLFSYAAAEFAKAWRPDVVHSHEWMCGFTNLFLKHTSIATVFTTHATMLGRALSSQHINVQTDFWTLDPEHEAKRVGVLAKFTTEKACAQHSNMFTTVSDTTAKEAHNVLGIQADAVVYNGLNFGDLPDKHPRYRQKLLDLRRKILAPYYQVDDDITVCGVFGRNEFVNKGYDLVIDALGKVNKTGTKLACFICVPMQNYGVRKDILDATRIERIPLSTHYIDEDNQYLQAARQASLHNYQQEHVEIFIVPIYLDGEDPLIGLDYIQAVQACDIGIYPSYYEPWGYTPMESAAFSSATITSNLSGFGQYCLNKGDHQGIWIIDRKELNFQKESRALARTIQEFCHKPRWEQEELGVKAKECVEHLDWDILVNQYFDVYSQAMQRNQKN